MLMPFTYQVQPDSIAASGTGIKDLTIQSDTLFWWVAVAASSSLDTDTDEMPNSFTVQIQDQSTGRMLSNIAVPQRIQTPRGGRRFRRPVFLRPNTTLRCTFVNLDSGNANVIKFDLIGFKALNLPAEGKTSSQIVPFTYLVNTGTMASSAKVIAPTLTMEADSVFELHAVAASSSLDADDDTMPNNFEVQIRDLSSGQYLSNALLPQRADTPKEGRNLIVPIIFSPSSNLEFTFLNLIASEQTVNYALIGSKIFVN